MTNSPAPPDPRQSSYAYGLPPGSRAILSHSPPLSVVTMSGTQLQTSLLDRLYPSPTRLLSDAFSPQQLQGVSEQISQGLMTRYDGLAKLPPLSLILRLDIQRALNPAIRMIVDDLRIAAMQFRSAVSASEAIAAEGLDLVQGITALLADMRQNCQINPTRVSNQISRCERQRFRSMECGETFKAVKATLLKVPDRCY